MSDRKEDNFAADLPGERTPPTDHEADLVRKARVGDRFAYGQIVLQYQDRLYNAILRLMGDADEAAELAQETFTRGLEKIGAFRGESGIYTWLFRIGLNLAFTQLRQRKRRRVFSLDAPEDGSGAGGPNQASVLLRRMEQYRDASPAEALEQRERSQQVLAALGRLDEEYRAVLVMRDIEQFSYEQMADLLSLPLGTLKSRLFRARVALRDELMAYMK